MYNKNTLYSLFICFIERKKTINTLERERERERERAPGQLATRQKRGPYLSLLNALFFVSLERLRRGGSEGHTSLYSFMLFFL
jgi:hypothetical protein